MNKSLFFSLAIAATLFALPSCDDAQVANHNLTKASDNFEVKRRVIFYNGITGDYILTIEGLVSLYDNGTGQLEVLVKTGPKTFKKHFLGLSDNVTYFCEQIEGAEVDVYHYRVTFKPSVIVPDVDVR